jgi:hypothetical protein
MNNIKSIRWLLFIMGLSMFWMFVPLLIVSRLVGHPLGIVGLVASLAFVWYGMPKVNAWLLQNSETFRVIWEWARENEETP